MTETKNAQAKNTTTKKSESKSKAKTATKSEKPKTETKKIDGNVDVRIIAVPERKDFVKKNQEILKLPATNIVWDKEHVGCVYTAKKAWCIETDKPFVLVMADDAELCKDFMMYCEKIIQVHPEKIISFFPNQFRKRNQVRNRERRSPYVSTREASGLAIMMKTDYIKPCLETWDMSIGDDVNITRWAKNNDIQIITTLPSLVQHIGDESVHDTTRSIGRTYFFNPDPKHENWDDGFVTSWSNVVL